MKHMINAFFSVVVALLSTSAMAGASKAVNREEFPIDYSFFSECLGDTKTYIRDFDQSLSESHSAQELVDKMMVLHSDLGNPYTLWRVAQSVVEQGQGAAS
jgi:hypothetical protein